MHIRILPESWLLCFLYIVTMSCQAQTNTRTPAREVNEDVARDAQIGEFVVVIFEDAAGHLWFGTMAEGVARYDGQQLIYNTMSDGLPGNTVSSLAQDSTGVIWLGTHSGLSRYDGKTFTNYTTQDGLCHDRISNLLIDSKGNFWIGTWGGVSRYDSKTFFKVDIPLPEITLPSYHGTELWVTAIMEDSQGNIWFGWDGYGACRYDGKTYAWFNKTNGLPSNNIQAICEDSVGNIWFGSRVAERDNPNADARTGPGGVAVYDGQSFTTFDTLDGLHHNDVYTIAKDRSGGIWVGATGYGLYAFTGDNYMLYKSTDRMDLTSVFGVQSFLEDRHGQIWFGFSGGLFRLEGDQIVHVSRERF